MSFALATAGNGQNNEFYLHFRKKKDVIYSREDNYRLNKTATGTEMKEFCSKTSVF